MTKRSLEAKVSISTEAGIDRSAFLLLNEVLLLVVEMIALPLW